MDKLNIALENCYGIGKLNFEFDLAVNHRSKGVYSIYAPNGFMKSSLARTFDDIAKKTESKDVIFPERATKRDVFSDGSPIDSSDVFVIKPYQESHSSEQVSLLLVNDTLKQQYDDALKKIQSKRVEFVKSLKASSGISGRKESVESVLCNCFGRSEKEFYDVISELNKQKGDFSQFSDITYNELFNEKALQLISSGNLSKELNEYIETYENLVDKSPILSKSFNHQSANSISKSLNDTGFFGAEHTVNLTLDGNKQEVFTHKELQQLIDGEQAKVLSDAGLAKKFAAIDKKLSNVDTKKLRDYLTEHKWLLPELADYKTLQNKLWLAYLQQHKGMSSELVEI